mgnify:CR=1 FL=1
MNLVRCNSCGKWIGCENDVKIVQDHEMCPICGASDSLMDLDSGCNFDDSELHELWNLFGDVPMNPETEAMEKEFLGFPAGTPREEIWHWFDKRYPGGVSKLLYGGGD